MKYIALCILSNDNNLSNRSQVNQIIDDVKYRFENKEPSAIVKSYQEDDFENDLDMAIVLAKHSLAHLCISSFHPFVKNNLFLRKLLDANIDFIFYDEPKISTPEQLQTIITCNQFIAETVSSDKQNSNNTSVLNINKPKPRGMATMSNEKIKEIIDKATFDRIRRAIFNKKNNELRKEIWSFIEEGWSYNKIAKYYNKVGKTTSNNKKFFPKTISRHYDTAISLLKKVERHRLNDTQTQLHQFNNNKRIQLKGFEHDQIFKDKIVFEIEPLIDSPIEFQLYNNKNEEVFSAKQIISSNTKRVEIDITKNKDILPGLYYIEMKTPKNDFQIYFNSCFLFDHFIPKSNSSPEIFQIK